MEPMQNFLIVRMRDLFPSASVGAAVVGIVLGIWAWQRYTEVPEADGPEDFDEVVQREAGSYDAQIAAPQR